MPAKAVGATGCWQLKGNSQGSASRRVAMTTTLAASVPGEAQCSDFPLFFRYDDVWSDWRNISHVDVGEEETAR